MLYVVLGATGNTGHAVADQLLRLGHRLRVVGRDPQRLAGLVAAGAEPAVGSLRDAAFLTRTFTGADGVYALVPPDYTTDDWPGTYAAHGTALAEALAAAGAPRTVLLSSIGAHLPAGLGPISLLHRVEAQLRAVPDLDLGVLRAAWFFENFLASLPAIRALGANGGHIRGDLPIDMVATQDIAAVAVAALTDPAPLGGRTLDLLGPRPWTLREATTRIGDAIGLTGLPYVELPAEQMAGALVQGGFSAHVAGMYVEMMDGFNRGLGVPEAGRSVAAPTPTTLEAFLPQLASAWQAM